MTDDGRRIVVTLDAEADGGVPWLGGCYESFAFADRLLDELASRDVPLTAFVEGRILDRRPELIRAFESFGTVFECHGYDHGAVGKPVEERLENMERGLDAYQAYFGCKPQGFRAPQGRIGHGELDVLVERGIRYDSSILPCFFPGRFNNLAAPTEPFRHRHSRLPELPFGVLHGTRFPLALSFAQLIGWPAFRTLFSLSAKPRCFIFNFHLHDLGPGEWLNSRRMPSSMYWGYRATLRRDPFAVLLRFLDYARSRGYRFVTAREWLESLELGRLALHDWRRDAEP